MDMWGVGCVFFEIVSLFPLFPGTNELDQIQKIHNIIGTPPADLLAKMKQRSQHMDFNFPTKEGSGIEKLIPHCSVECIDLINKLLTYNPDDRLSARQALRHPYFRDVRDQEKRQQALLSPELSASNGGQLSLPPATSDSSASASSRARRAKDDEGLLPSIAGKGAEHSSDKENEEGVYGEGSEGHAGGGAGGAKGKHTSSLPSMVIGGGRSSNQEDEDDGHPNLPPIGSGMSGGIGAKLAGKMQGGKGINLGGGYHNYGSYKGSLAKQTARTSGMPKQFKPPQGVSAHKAPIGGAHKTTGASVAGVPGKKPAYKPNQAKRVPGQINRRT